MKVITSPHISQCCWANVYFLETICLIQRNALHFREGYQRDLAIGFTLELRAYVRHKFFKTSINKLLDYVGR